MLGWMDGCMAAHLGPCGCVLLLAKQAEPLWVAYSFGKWHECLMPAALYALGVTLPSHSVYTAR